MDLRLDLLQLMGHERERSSPPLRPDFVLPLTTCGGTKAAPGPLRRPPDAAPAPPARPGWNAGAPGLSMLAS